MNTTTTYWTEGRLKRLARVIAIAYFRFEEDRQDCTAALWMKGTTMAQDRPDMPKAEMYAILRNAAFDMGRKRVKKCRDVRLTLSYDAVPDIHELIQGPQMDHASHLLETLRRELPADFYQVIVARHIGLSYADIGEQLGVIEGTVRSRHSRAMVLARAILTEGEPLVN